MSEAKSKLRHPPGLAVLFFTEMWERFGFYTMLAIFVLYLDEYFHFDNVGDIYGIYLAFVYFTPIFGGLIADKLLGFRKTIIIGAIFMAIGYGLIAIPLAEDPAQEKQVQLAEQVYASAHTNYKERYELAKQEATVQGKKFNWTEPKPEYKGPKRTARYIPFFIALIVLVIGNGLFKPNISVMVGNLYPDGSPLKDSAFNIFYMGINVGALFAPLAAAGLRSTMGWSWAFGASAIGMLISLVIFQVFKKHILHAEISHSDQSQVKVEDIPRKEKIERILALITIFAIVIVFWMSFHQNGFTMTLWARDNTGPLFGLFQIPAEIFAAFNPLFVITLTPPLVMFWAWRRKKGKEPSTPGKIGIGMLLTAASFFVMAVAGQMGGDFGRVSPWFLISSYAVVTTGELCLSPMGLSFVSKVAPPNLRGLMMGGWFAATAVGNYFAGKIEFLWERWPHSYFFMFLVVMCLLSALLLRLVLNRLKKATKGV